MSRACCCGFRGPYVSIRIQHVPCELVVAHSLLNVINDVQCKVRTAGLPAFKNTHACSWSSFVSYTYRITLEIQIAQCRSYLQTLGPNVGIIYRHGSPGSLILRRPFEGLHGKPFTTLTSLTSLHIIPHDHANLGSQNRSPTTLSAKPCKL